MTYSENGSANRSTLSMTMIEQDISSWGLGEVYLYRVNLSSPLSHTHHYIAGTGLKDMAVIKVVPLTSLLVLGICCVWREDRKMRRSRRRIATVHVQSSCFIHSVLLQAHQSGLTQRTGHREDEGCSHSQCITDRSSPLQEKKA